MPDQISYTVILAAAAIAFLAAAGLALLSHRMLAGARSLPWLAGADTLLALTHIGVALRPLGAETALTLAINLCAVGAFLSLLKGLAEALERPVRWSLALGAGAVTLAGQAWFTFAMPLMEARVGLFQVMHVVFLILALRLLATPGGSVPRPLKGLIGGLLGAVFLTQMLRIVSVALANGLTPQINALSVLLLALLGLLWTAALIAAEAARLRHALAKSEERFSISIETIPDSAAINRAVDGVYVAVNRAFTQTTGWPAEDIVGRGSIEAGIWEHPEERQALVRRLGETPMVAEHTATFRARDGRLIQGIMSASLIDMGGVPHIVSITRDQTERLKREEDLGRALDHLAAINQELQHFAHAAAHDLKEPLRSIVSYSQILERRLGPDLPAERRAELTFIVDAGRRMHDLISGLDAYARIDDRSVPFQPINPNHALADARANLARAIADAEAEVVSDDLPPVIGDATQITQLFQNLLANALKFRRAGVPCRVWISATRATTPDNGERALVGFTVRDNGIGFTAAEAERIFAVFTRLDAAAAYPGSGMGLSICRRIVERHGGTIHAEGTPGRGCLVRFTLPSPPPGPPPVNGSLPGRD
ncbi:sensor histidine kinase [Roseospirillum parvum]|uniref:histidine kinase n=1 Tax=Roseospirillum parvum TaxID=83401 RepID=A0A1G7U1B5_9PROT|nr:ATP-binding protein [Roseospirillum parvum]SDG41208.1 PAS domain S-box-containing protein [Roseospirillum parvum]